MLPIVGANIQKEEFIVNIFYRFFARQNLYVITFIFRENLKNRNKFVLKSQSVTEGQRFFSWLF